MSKQTPNRTFHPTVTASDWRSGQGTPLYLLACYGRVLSPKHRLDLMREIQQAYNATDRNNRHYRSYRELRTLYRYIRDRLI